MTHTLNILTSNQASPTAINLAHRVFGYAMLARSMPDVMLWLSVCAVLGVLNGTIRLIALIQPTCSGSD